MRRTGLVLGLLACGCFQTQLVSAQDARLSIQLFALAEFPLFSDDEFNVRYPTVYEYKVFSEWLENPYQQYRSPASFDLVAVIVNHGGVPADRIVLNLTGDRRIGEFWDFESEPHPRETAVWEGLTEPMTLKMGSLDPRTVGTWRIESVLVRDLINDLADQDLWPWELRYEVTLACDNCGEQVDSAASIRMYHSH